MDKNISVVFFGSGPVAAKSLALLTKKFLIEAVITKPSTLEMMTLASPENKPLAVTSRAELDDLFVANRFTSQLAVLIDFGIIVSQKVIDYFPLGIVNSHFSLLPEWRGADPISFAILSGQKKTGVSLMLLAEKMDQGPLLAQKTLAISPDDTGTTLADKLIVLSDRMLADCLSRYIGGELALYPQAKNGVSYSRKLVKSDGQIDWSKSAEQIEREIRAFAAWPKSYTRLGSLEVIVTGAHAEPSRSAGANPGNLEAVAEVGTLMVSTGSGSLHIDRLKPVGKTEMTVAEFLRGYASRIDVKTEPSKGIIN